MNSSFLLRFSSASALLGSFVVVLLAALPGCNGQTVDGGGTDTTKDAAPDSAEPTADADVEDANADAKSDNDPDSSHPVDGDAGCVDIEVLPAELTCEVDSDCTAVVTGPVCPGYQGNPDTFSTLCLNGVANSVGAARIAAQVAAIPHGDDAGIDFCDTLGGEQRCLGGQCISCPPPGFNPNEGPPACFDAGPTTIVVNSDAG
jgi:hypothetical protein